MRLNKKNRRLAYLHFWPELNGKCKPGYHLHHIDANLKREDPERYQQWNPEDLVPVTKSEHRKLHDIILKSEGKKGVVMNILDNWTSESRKRGIEKRSVKIKELWSKPDFREKMKHRYHGKMDQSARENLSKKRSVSNTGKHWFNNGTDNVFSHECPEGYKEGRIMRK